MVWSSRGIMEYNITLKDVGGKWKVVHATKDGSMVVVSEGDNVMIVDSDKVVYNEDLKNFTIEAYIYVKDVSGRAAVDRVRADLDNLNYLKVNARYL